MGFAVKHYSKLLDGNHDVTAAVSTRQLWAPPLIIGEKKNKEDGGSASPRQPLKPRCSAAAAGVGMGDGTSTHRSLSLDLAAQTSIVIRKEERKELLEFEKRQIMAGQLRGQSRPNHSELWKAHPRVWQAVPRTQQCRSRNRRVVNMEQCKEWVRVLKWPGDERSTGCSSEALAECLFLRVTLPKKNEDGNDALLSRGATVSDQLLSDESNQNKPDQECSRACEEALENLLCAIDERRVMDLVRAFHKMYTV
ncbi:hypothetical protein ANCCEY_13435 [Ancylostoma ceylanicum]|uniref:Uncharacterized protein n=1 Tax=Ancylostoma ceylanicum TaxID=53326 RepID=A0A0D6L7I9_9BILA|nr:hypothetical protein ANCCEY_13435 [Ancylostoma ceylanicum]